MNSSTQPHLQGTFDKGSVRYLRIANQFVNGAALVLPFADRRCHGVRNDFEELCPGPFNCKGRGLVSICGQCS
jgi:hypothetical protein